MKNLPEKVFLTLAVLALAGFGFAIGYYFLFAAQFILVILAAFIAYKIMDKLDTGDNIMILLGGIIILIGIFIGDIYYFSTINNISIPLLR